MAGSFKFLEDVALADAAFEASGDSLSEVFQSAAHALLETLANPSTVASSWKHTIERQEADISALLFDWLSEIVYLKDAEGVVFREAIPRVTEDSRGGEWRLTGTLIGAPIDPAVQELHADVKGVTKHLYEVWQADNRWHARVVLDI